MLITNPKVQRLFEPWKIFLWITLYLSLSSAEWLATKMSAYGDELHTHSFTYTHNREPRLTLRLASVPLASCSQWIFPVGGFLYDFILWKTDTLFLPMREIIFYCVAVLAFKIQHLLILTKTTIIFCTLYKLCENH